MQNIIISHKVEHNFYKSIPQKNDHIIIINFLIIIFSTKYFVFDNKSDIIQKQVRK